MNCDQFLALLKTSGLVSPEEWDEVRAHPVLREEPQNAKRLAEELIREGKLTRYQSVSLLQGKAKKFQVNEYLLLDKLGQGGMGVVYKARHRRMKRIVALKMIAPAAVHSKEAVRRFYREIEAVAKLHHPHIVIAYDAGECEGRHYLAMEYVEGIDLGALVERRGVLPILSAVRFILQAAQGLAYAHANGIIHRDIKPSNLLVSRESSVKILDLGLARLTDAVGASRGTRELTDTGQIIGTVDYMSPEQALDTRHVDPRSDIYSLGCTLFKVLVNRPLYEGGSLVEKLLAHRTQPIPVLSDLRPEVTPDLEATFTRMVAKDPNERFASMDELIAELEAFLVARKSAAYANTVTMDRPAEPDIKTWLARAVEPGSGGSPAAQAEHATVASRNRDATRVDDGHPRGAKGARPRRRFPWRIATISLVTLAALAGGFLLRGRPERTAANRPTSAASPSSLASRADGAGGSAGPANEPRGASPPAAPRKTPSGPPADEKPVFPQPLDWTAAWRDADAQGRALLAERKFGAAIERYRAVADQYDAAELKQRATDAIQKIDTAADNAWRELESKARFLLEEKKFDEARLAIQPALSDFGIARIADGARGVAGHIDAVAGPSAPADVAQPLVAAKTEPMPLAPPAESPAVKQQRAADARYAELLAPVEALVAAWQFRDALDALEKLEPTEPESRDRVAQRRDEVGRLAALKVRLVNAILGRAGSLTKASLGLKGVSGTVMGASDDGIASANAAGKQELHRWSELNDAARRKVLALAVDSKSEEDALAMALLFLAVRDIPQAEVQFKRAQSLGLDVTPYQEGLASIRLATAHELIAKKKYQEAHDALAGLEEKFQNLSWLAGHRDLIRAARDHAAGELTETAADRLYDEAVEYWRRGALFDARPLVQRLLSEYPQSRAVVDARRDPPFDQLRLAIQRLGQKFTVRLDGKGDYKSVQEAVSAAPERSLIEIQDNGPYNERIVVDKEGLVIRGAKGSWPLITSAGSQRNFPVLFSAQAPGVVIERLLLVHSFPVGTSPETLQGTALVRSCVVYGKCNGFSMEGTIEDSVLFSGIGGPQLTIRNSVCFLENIANNGRGEYYNSLFCRSLRPGSGPLELRGCTLFGPLIAPNPESLVSDCILEAIESSRATVKVEHCTLYGKTPFIDAVRPGTGCFQADPQFANPKIYDFRLLPASPCRGRASDGGDVGCRLTPAMVEIMGVTSELRRRGLIEF